MHLGFGKIIYISGKLQCPFLQIFSKYFVHFSKFYTIHLILLYFKVIMGKQHYYYLSVNWKSLYLKIHLSKVESGSGITLYQTTVHDYCSHFKMKAEIIYFSSFSFSQFKNLIELDRWKKQVIELHFLKFWWQRRYPNSFVAK